MEYREFASIVYHKTDARVKFTDTEIEIEIGCALSCQRMLAFLSIFPRWRPFAILDL